MSMPKFPELPNLDIESSVAQILSSIALEEVALSHILNAEGEKIQYALGTLENSTLPEPATIDEVLKVNESVKDMLGTVSLNQMFLLGKMSKALDAFKENKKNGPTKTEAVGSYLSMIQHQLVNRNEPVIFDVTVSEKGVTKNADHSFTLNESKYWKVDFGASMASTEGGPAEVMFYLDDVLISNLPLFDSFQRHYTRSFIIPAKQGSVLKVIGVGNPIRFESLQSNAYLTINSVADY